MSIPRHGAARGTCSARRRRRRARRGTRSARWSGAAAGCSGGVRVAGPRRSCGHMGGRSSDVAVRLNGSEGAGRAAARRAGRRVVDGAIPAQVLPGDVPSDARCAGPRRCGGEERAHAAGGGAGRGSAARGREFDALRCWRREDRNQKQRTVDSRQRSICG